METSRCASVAELLRAIICLDSGPANTDHRRARLAHAEYALYGVLIGIVALNSVYYRISS
jgi:hypothetical protein